MTLREETEWVETVEAGWNVLVGTSLDAILDAIHDHRWPVEAPAPIFGTGHSAQAIVNLLR